MSRRFDMLRRDWQQTVFALMYNLIKGARGLLAV